MHSTQNTTTNNSGKESGMAAIEMAMVLPMLMLLVLGTVDFSRYLWTRHVAHAAASEGVRLATLHEPSVSDVQAYVNERLHEGGIDATSSVQVSARTPGQPLTVTVNVDFNLSSVSGLLAENIGLDHVRATGFGVMER